MVDRVIRNAPAVVSITPAWEYLAIGRDVKNSFRIRGAGMINVLNEGYEMLPTYNWLLTYYDGDSDSVCVITEATENDIRQMVAWMNESVEYAVGSIVRLSATATEGIEIDEIDEPVVFFDDDFLKVNDLPKYTMRINTDNEGRIDIDFLDDTGAIVGDF